jgi:hypothetical protein
LHIPRDGLSGPNYTIMGRMESTAVSRVVPPPCVHTTTMTKTIYGARIQQRWGSCQCDSLGGTAERPLFPVEQYTESGSGKDELGRLP